MKRYELLLLDADGTVLDFVTAETKALHATCAAMGMEIDDGQVAVYAQINDALWRAFERGEISQESLRQERFARFLAYLEKTGDAMAMADQYVHFLGEQADEIPGARAFMKAAAARVPILIVTNGISAVQRSRFARSPLKQYVTGYVISGELGVAKPDPRMIHVALEMGKASAQDALMVGDAPRSDIAAANAAGVDSCWFNPEGRPNDTEHVPTYEVRALEEILQWL